MLLVSENQSVYYNLALEEYLLETWRQEQPLVVLYRNNSSVVVGAHQNTHREADSGVMASRGIALARRISGGGTVYHDLGNVCFAFVVSKQNPNRLELPVYLQPMAETLHALGIPVHATSRNDMLLAGKKITGTAARMKSDCLLFHGTLLYDANLENLRGVLRPEQGLVFSKGSPSVKSPVENIRAAYDLGSAQDFMEQLAAMLNPDGGCYHLTPEGAAAVEALAENKYASRSWICGRNPVCEYSVLVGALGEAPHRVRLSLKGDIVYGASDPELQFLVGTDFDMLELAQKLALRGLSLARDPAAVLVDEPLR